MPRTPSDERADLAFGFRRRRQFRLESGEAPTFATSGKGMKVYLSGPFSFSEAGRFFLDCLLQPTLLNSGMDVIRPWALTDSAETRAVETTPAGDQRVLAWQRLKQAIGQQNRISIDACDAMVALLDGLDIDSGTAADIGYAFGRGKPIIGYRGDHRLTGDNEGAAANAQVEYFISASGGSIESSFDALVAAIKTQISSSPA